MLFIYPALYCSETTILFRGEFEIIPVNPGVCCCRASDPLFRGCHQSGSLSGVTRERHPASQSEHLCMPKNFSAYKGTARSHLAMGKLRGGESLTEVSKILRYGFWGGSVPSAILQPFRGKKKPSVRTGADWSGHRNRSVLPCCILRQD